VDPLTHALVGAATARAVMRGRPPSRPGARGATLLLLAGAFGALLPDIDRVIHSPSDPLLHIEFHRHFTHALAFIPVGGALATLPWMVARSLRPHWRAVLLAATLGYATHGLLDASTTYGTLLLWPFSDRRVAWTWISIVDPVFTLVLLAGVAIAWRERRGRAAAALTLVLCLTYLGVGAWQRDRASAVQRQVARARGHDPVRAAVFPGFANQIIWRSIYEADGTLYLDRLRVPWAGTPTWSAGSSVARVAASDLRPPAHASPRVQRDLRRFQWFADGWVARSALDPSVIGDARYSLAPDRFEPVWGVRVTPDQDPPLEWVDHSRGRRVDLRVWRDEVLGRDPAFGRLPSAAPRISVPEVSPTGIRGRGRLDTVWACVKGSNSL
jgi:inner membrane protein